jgi:hypothetical protein
MYMNYDGTTYQDRRTLTTDTALTTFHFESSSDSTVGVRDSLSLLHFYVQHRTRALDPGDRTSPPPYY